MRSYLLFFVVAFACPLLVLAQEQRRGDFYTSFKHIYELNPSNFDDIVHKTNHTSVVEFYAPWCGYCVQFENEFKKASKVASDFVQFGAVNCDDPNNKQFCAEHRVEGFPTVMIFRPPKVNLKEAGTGKKRQHATEIYKGERKAAPLVEFVKGRVKNYTKKISFLKVDQWLNPTDKSRVLLITDKSSLSPMYKSLSIDYLESVELGYITIKQADIEKDLRAKIPSLPSDAKLPILLAIDKDTKEIKYLSDKPFNKENISKFISQFGEPLEGELSKRGRLLKGIRKNTIPSSPVVNKNNSLNSLLSGNKRKKPQPARPHIEYIPESSKRTVDQVINISDEEGDQPTQKHLKPNQDEYIKPSSPVDSKTQAELEKSKRLQDEIRQLKLQARLPLAERLRPTSLKDYIGQEHLVGKGGILRGFILHDRVPSLILWGFPGTGKTTLARIISNSTKCRFVELSATANGIQDCKKVFEEAKNELKLTKRRTIVFVDEIHRFNKAQQDIFLPPVEKGTIVLIGATTENPSFQLNSALLSRCRVFVLKKLEVESLIKIINKAWMVINRTRKLVLDKPTLRLSKEAIEYLCDIADGDSRSALNLLELVDSHYMTNDDEISEASSAEPSQQSQQSQQSASKKIITIEVSAEQLRLILKRTHMVYDRVGDAHYDTISAFHKSVRGNNPDAAMYYLARMLKGGESPLYIARRMIRIASEDVGVLDESCLPFAVAAYHAVQYVGLPEADLALAHCAVKLALAPKSVEVYRAWGELNSKLDNEPGFAAAPIPMHLRNAPTKLMDDLGYAENYKYPPNFKDGKVKQEYFPEGWYGMKILKGKHMGDEIDRDLNV
ncbi:hypothetical protein CANARDRAFT_194652 [[Candida] arabinofermentans NRRL YB-2248]|uniref:Thioredoxin domain-containing protein n=1 Tax=[Candida] arabinofermentans NRRL YB-2248 TaxID=983967 RepID=A0A1E4T628_9ASCO|nr:hypothetical protein CANARDRAFT_194652 [[Candida] arabinofermentans NRRL YB-2248]